MTISEAMNTYNPALRILRDRGYYLEVLLDEAKEEIFRWSASKNGNNFFAFNPLSLLAICTISEELGQEWKNYNTEDIYDELLEKAT